MCLLVNLKFLIFRKLVFVTASFAGIDFGAKAPKLWSQFFSIKSFGTVGSAQVWSNFNNKWQQVVIQLVSADLFVPCFCYK